MSFTYDRARNIHLNVKLKTLMKADASFNVSLVLFQCRLNATWNIKLSYLTLYYRSQKKTTTKRIMKNDILQNYL